MAAEARGRASPERALRQPAERRLQGLGLRIRARRIACDLSMTALADAAGLTVEAVRRVERGELDAGVAGIGAMARVLGMRRSIALREEDSAPKHRLSPARALHALAAEEPAFEDALAALAALARVLAARSDDEA